jgi:nitroreductase
MSPHKTTTRPAAKKCLARWRFCDERVLAFMRFVPCLTLPQRYGWLEITKAADGADGKKMLNRWLMPLDQLKLLPFARGLAKEFHMTQLNDTSSVLAFLKSRKSASAKAMGGAGPSAAQLEEILSVGVRVPDHGKLAPWRFILFEGDARAGVGRGFAARWAELHPEHGAESLAFQSGLFERAPMVIAVVSTAAPHGKIPVWEQQMSAAAVCYNIVLAATAMGFAAQWQSDWVAYDVGAKFAMGVLESEQVAGLIYIGQSTVELEDRPRPDAKALLTRWVAP